MSIFMAAICLLVSSVSWAVPRISFELTSHVHPSQRTAVVRTYRAAMQAVQALPPELENPFRAPGGRIVKILLTTTRDPFAAGEAAANPDSDSFTATGAVENWLVTFIVVLTDRIMRDPETGEGRSDATVRMVNALGYQIYGQLPQQLKLVYGIIPKNTQAEIIEEAVIAYTAGIEFMKRYQTSEFAAAVSAIDIGSAIAREEEKLKVYSDAHCNYQTARQARLKKKS